MTVKQLREILETLADTAVIKIHDARQDQLMDIQVVSDDFNHMVIIELEYPY